MCSGLITHDLAAHFFELRFLEYPKNMRRLLKRFVFCVAYFAISFVGVNILRYLMLKPLYKYTVLNYSGVGHPCYASHPSLPHVSKLWNFVADYGGYVVDVIFLAIGFLLLTRMASKPVFKWLGIILINSLLFEALSFPWFWVSWYHRNATSFVYFIQSRTVPVYLLWALTWIISFFVLRWTIQKFQLKKEALSLLYIAPLAFCFCYMSWFYCLPPLMFKLQR